VRWEDSYSTMNRTSLRWNVTISESRRAGYFNNMIFIFWLWHYFLYIPSYFLHIISSFFLRLRNYNPLPPYIGFGTWKCPPLLKFLHFSFLFHFISFIFHHISFIFSIYFFIYSSYFLHISSYFPHLSSFFLLISSHFLHILSYFLHISPIFLYFSWGFGTITTPPMYRPLPVYRGAGTENNLEIFIYLFWKCLFYDGGADDSTKTN